MPQCKSNVLLSVLEKLRCIFAASNPEKRAFFLMNLSSVRCVKGGAAFSACLYTQKQKAPALCANQSMFTGLGEY